MVNERGPLQVFIPGTACTGISRICTHFHYTDIFCWCEIRKLIYINTQHLCNITFTAFFRKILLNLTTFISHVTFCFHNHELCISTVALLLGHPAHLPKHLFHSP